MYLVLDIESAYVLRLTCSWSSTSLGTMNVDRGRHIVAQKIPGSETPSEEQMIMDGDVVIDGRYTTRSAVGDVVMEVHQATAPDPPN
jgi:hypothetical protein